MVRATAALARDLPDVYTEEVDLLLRDIIAKTPPKTKSQGQRRVEADIRYTAYAVHEKFLHMLLQRFGPGPYHGLLNQGKGKTVPLAYARILTTVNQLRAWHEARRHSITGRTKKLYSNYLDNPTKAFVSKGVMAAYLRQAKRNVGTAKGGWASAQLAVSRGRPLPTWITEKRHQGTHVKRFSIHLSEQQLFTAINRSPWAKRTRDANALVAASLRNRARQIPVKVEKQLKLRYSAAGFLVSGSNIIGL